jgi:hypothetical protein
MELEEFQHSLSSEAPPASLNLAVQALWYEAKGDWERAHTLAQEVFGPEGAWVHAFLHRKEGDEGNARYWYSRAGKSFPSISIEDEWRDIAQTLLWGAEARIPG